MFVSQKSQYALRAIYELSLRHGQGTVRIAEIAQSQAIPLKFLEIIMNQLKQGGFVGARRGSGGGYFLLRTPAEITVGDVLRFIQGPVGPVVCVDENSPEKCTLYETCVFLPMWEKARKALSEVYDTTTFQTLIDQWESQRENRAASES